MAKVDVAFVVHAKSREALGCIGLAGHDVHRLTATLLELDRRDGCLCKCSGVVLRMRSYTPLTGRMDTRWASTQGLIK